MDALLLHPFFADAFRFALEKATPEGKITISVLALVSMFSWTVILGKARQLYRATKMSKRFFAAYRSVRDPLEIFNKKLEFNGAPAYDIYYTGVEELAYHLKHNPVEVKRTQMSISPNQVPGAETDGIVRAVSTKISNASFESVKVALERSVSAESISLEKGMIILTTAVAGGPFLGLLGTVWGVMETFSGIAQKQAASLQAMAPGVAGALIATVVGLFVAIPAMFAYNYMVTMIRHMTQQLDNFVTELATSIEHAYVDNRSVSEEIADALQRMREEQRLEPIAAGD